MKEITPESIQQLHLRLKTDQDLTKKYLTMKAGFNSSDPVQAFKAMELYEDFGLITEKNELYPYFCQVSESIFPSEFTQCV